MGRSFYVSGYRDAGSKDRWVTDQLDLKGTDKHPGAMDLPVEEVPIMNPLTGEQAIHPITGKPRSRRVRRDSALGLDADNVVYKGDRVVPIAEEVEIQGGKPTGRILYHFNRIADDGRSRGEHTSIWEKTQEGRMTYTGKTKRRYFT